MALHQPRRVRLIDLGLRVGERWPCEYDFSHGRQHDVKLEQSLPVTFHGIWRSPARLADVTSSRWVACSEWPGHAPRGSTRNVGGRSCSPRGERSSAHGSAVPDRAERLGADTCARAFPSAASVPRRWCAAGTVGTRQHQMQLRTWQRWLHAYRHSGLVGLVRKSRRDRGQRALSAEVEQLIEGLALRRPPLSCAAVHREVATAQPRPRWRTTARKPTRTGSGSCIAVRRVGPTRSGRRITRHSIGGSSTSAARRRAPG